MKDGLKVETEEVKQLLINEVLKRDLIESEAAKEAQKQIQKAYKLAMEEFIRNIKTECLNFNIDYNLVETSQPFDKALLNYIQKRSKLY